MSDLSGDGFSDDYRESNGSDDDFQCSPEQPKKLATKPATKAAKAAASKAPALKQTKLTASKTTKRPAQVESSDDAKKRVRSNVVLSDSSPRQSDSSVESASSSLINPPDQIRALHTLDNQIEDNVVPKVDAMHSKPASLKNASETYKKLTQLEHVLLRPDTYIGSVEKQTQPMWVYDSSTESMVYRPVTFVPGLYKIFDEILVNAADNKIRDVSMDTIKVVFDRENNIVSVYNNGRGIPIELHAKEHIYIPELIFGHLLTSSNYDDNERKVTGGRNGYGAKLCNIFCTEFIVETADKATKKKYKQVFNANMTKKSAPKITSNSKGDEYTKINFRADLAKFNMSHLDDDIEAVMKRRIYDIAGTVKNVKVYLNNERIKMKNFKQYVEMYVNSAHKDEEASSKPTIVYEVVNDRWEVAFAVSNGQFQQVSFVNSIATTKGGTHVDMIANQIIVKIIEQVKKKNKAATVKPHQVRSHTWLFINCLIENPTFDSQTKENMTLRTSSFGSKCNLSDDFIRKVLKSEIVEVILDEAKTRADKEMKKTDSGRSSKITGLPKLEDANNAGTKNGHRCTLILTEGDSAKALAIAGISIVGRDNFGVFPLRGKLLNVREAPHAQIMANAEIQAIKKIMGLQHQKHYSTASELRYGHLMIMTDQDYDGSHIKGLIINYLETFYPSLLAIEDFLVEFITPIVKCTKGKEEVSFFTLPEFDFWKKDNNDGMGWHVKYYKGLGTSTAADARKYFSALDRHLKQFQTVQEGDKELIDLAFSKKKADERKEWLRLFKPGTYIDHSLEKIPISDFINKELILYSMADNIRSIPSVIDGLKPGQRKILYGCFKRKLRKEIKVQQLVGYVSEQAAYHHGEASLTQTIIGLAQNFVGSNNINLLDPNGQFGTRLQGGKDASAARYIFTNLSNLSRKLFIAADDPLLTSLNDDGQIIEPQWYIPILPLVLVNGCEGIGTGWSTFIPNFNPLDIVTNIRNLMEKRELTPMLPWYRGFKGTIEKQGDRYKVSGIIEQIGDTTLRITELPIRFWTESMKEFLAAGITGTEKQPPFIKDYSEYHTETTVHFIVKLTEKGMNDALAEGLEQRFKLVNYLSFGNMVAFDAEGRIKKYSSPEEILEYFYHIRLEYYQRRKDHLAEDLLRQFDRLSNQARFVQMIVDKQLSVSGRKRVDIIRDLKEKSFMTFEKLRKVQPSVDGEEEEVEEANMPAETDQGYDYLLGMAIWSLTREKVDRLLQEKQKKEEELNRLLQLSAKDLWNNDLKEFETEWKLQLAEYENISAKEVERSARNSNGKTGKVRKPVRKQKAIELSSEG